MGQPIIAAAAAAAYLNTVGELILFRESSFLFDFGNFYVLFFIEIRGFRIGRNYLSSVFVCM